MVCYLVGSVNGFKNALDKYSTLSILTEFEVCVFTQRIKRIVQTQNYFLYNIVEYNLSTHVIFSSISCFVFEILAVEVCTFSTRGKQG